MKDLFSIGIKHQLFNNEVRRRRLELGLTQKQLEERLGGWSNLSGVETFKKYPTPLEAERLAKALNTTVEILFPKWLEELKDKRTSVVTTHLVTERILDHPELKALPSPDSMEKVEDKIDQELLKGKLGSALDTLLDREKKVLKLRYGLENGRQLSLEDTGREFGVTRERIRQIEAKALRKLRKPTRTKQLKGFL